jgi:bacterial leucyl aminopeptidase
MGMSQFGSVAVWLACATPAFAAPAMKATPAEQQQEVWISIGSDTLSSVRAFYAPQGVALPAATAEAGGVSVLRLSRAQVEQVGHAVHEGLNRCAGFMAHDTEEQALAAAKADSTPQPLPAPTYFINNAPTVNALMGGVREFNLRNTINALSGNFANRRYDTQLGADAATWLKSQWTELAQGRSDITVELFAHSWMQPSVIATIQGTTLPGEIVVLGGHLDSINQSGKTLPAPGADDDASGVACVSEIFRLAIARGYKPARTVKFMAYAAEEVGLYGSQAIANSFKSSGANVVGVMQLDMTNYKGSTYDIGITTDRTSAALNTHTINLITTYLPTLTYTQFACGYGCSDHASWTSAGFPSTMPFEATIGTDNQAIHTANDTLTTMGGTANHSMKFARLGAAFMAETAKGAAEGFPVPPLSPAQANTAVFDATFKTPRCADLGLSCDSGTLLNGRANLGPELNRPNTIKGSCEDGTSGLFRTDETIDRIKVGTVDGSDLAAGKAARIDVTLFAYSATADVLELYSAPDANSPVWTLIGKYSPSAAGISTLSATYTLPTGGVQAVRARLRYKGDTGACGTGLYDDHDDLVFAVGG